jgi:hypothetical protein
MKLLKEAPVDALPMLLIVDEKVVAAPAVAETGETAPAVRSGEDAAAHVVPFHEVPAAHVTVDTSVPYVVPFPLNEKVYDPGPTNVGRCPPESEPDSASDDATSAVGAVFR